MKERPIIFTSESVRAILDGRKTQTRRIVKHIPMLGEPLAWCAAAKAQEPGWVHIVGDHRRFCPYGQPGDRLWVREAFFDHSFDGEKDVTMIEYRASEWERDGDGGGWSPSIHMPRWASRIVLEITGVRVERLQEITEIDAQAEGVLEMDGQLNDLALVRRAKAIGECVEDGRVWFAELWDSINGKRASWESNPWVWVIEFRRVNQ